jgi:hypothetical protein
MPNVGVQGPASTTPPMTLALVVPFKGILSKNLPKLPNLSFIGKK